jgi:hypothetical protein
MESLNIMALQCVILIRKWIKLNWSVTLVIRIRACEGVDTTFIHFKQHIFTQGIEIIVLLREEKLHKYGRVTIGHFNEGICWRHCTFR